MNDENYEDTGAGNELDAPRLPFQILRHSIRRVGDSKEDYVFFLRHWVDATIFGVWVFYLFPFNLYSLSGITGGKNARRRWKAPPAECGP